MNVGVLTFLAAAPLVALSGCDPAKLCDASMKSYEIEMKRSLVVDGPLDTLTVEACVDGRCVTGASDATGILTFDRNASHDNASEGVIDRATGTITVTFALLERDATTRTLVRVRREGQTILEELGNVHWNEGDCHSSPATLSI